MSVFVRVETVVVDAGKILLNEAHEAAVRTTVLRCLGSYPRPGETLEACAVRVGKDALALNLQVRRLLYVYEGLWKQGAEDQHELWFYFLCGVRGGIEATPEGRVTARDPKLSLRLYDVEMMDPQRLFPPFLRRELPRDVRSGFKEPVRHVVDDQRES